MKETIKINLNGQLFDLDNDAYECLKQYLDSLKLKFSSSPNEADEILEDIESRIAEILQQKISSSKQVITLVDIEEIISLMGTADEMDESEEKENNTQSTSKQTTNTKKRFYRDQQNSVLGGVGSGIAAYFDIDPIWIRLLFVFLTFANLAGPVIYVILWAILPPAITTAQRLEMQGKSLNINDIEDSVKNEFSKVKRSVKDIPNSKAYRNTEGALSEMFKALGAIIIVFIKIVGAIIGVSLIVALVSIILSLFAGGAVFLPWNFIHNLHWPNFLNMHNTGLLGLCLFFVIAIPIAGLLGKIIKFLLNIKSTNRFAAGIGATIWVVAFITLIVLIVAENDKGLFRQSRFATYKLNTIENKPLYIALKSKYYYKDEIDHYQIFNFHFSYNDDRDEFLKKPSLKIRESENNEVKLIIERNYTNLKIGRVYKRSYDLVDYSWQINDTLLLLDEHYTCYEEDVWRLPYVNLTLKIPEGKGVYFDDNLAKLLSTKHNTGGMFYMQEGRLRRQFNE